MTYEQAYAYIHEAHRAPGVERNLQHMRRLLEAMGNPQQKLAIVHIAGTNGKGSTAAMLEAMLRSRYKTGLYTSPFLQEFTERFRVNGRNMPPEILIQAVQAVQQADRQIGQHSLPFEIYTAMALWWFAREQVDIVVLEAGIGGLLDCTNVVTPCLSVITPIGMDHMRILGDTLESIAAQKAGIIKPGVPAVIAAQQPVARQVLQQAAQAAGSPLVDAGLYTPQLLHADSSGSRFDLPAVAGQPGLPGAEGLFLRLLGRYQLQNAATAWAAACTLQQNGWQITEQDRREGLAQVRWPGRLERVCDQPLVLIDGAHNPHGAAALAQALPELIGSQPVVLVVGALDHDFMGVIQQLAPFASYAIATQPNNNRATHPAALAWYLSQTLSRQQISLVPDVAQAVRQAMDLAQQLHGCVVVAGSLYVAGEARSVFYPVHSPA